MVRKLTLTISLFATVLFTSLNPTKVYALILDDGNIHNISWILNEGVAVKDNTTSGNFTTMNLLLNGTIELDVHAYDNSRINVNGGTMSLTLYTFDNSIATFSEGTIGSVCACDSSNINVSGGSIIGNLRADDSAEIIFSGGLIGNNILAGELSSDNSIITFVGNNFTINGVSVGYGQYFYNDYDNGHLSGKLANGEAIDNDFYIVGDSSIILIPEPSTLLLLGLGALLIRRRK